MVHTNRMDKHLGEWIDACMMAPTYTVVCLTAMSCSPQVGLTKTKYLVSVVSFILNDVFNII